MSRRIGNGRVETSREELVANGSWNATARTGFVEIDGKHVKVREMHDSCAPIESATWFVECATRSTADPMAGMILLTTPEEDFGTHGGGSGEPA